MKKNNGNKGPRVRSNSKTKKKKKDQAGKCNKAECSEKKKSIEVTRSGQVTEPERPSILDILKNDQDCNCEIVARAVRSNVHMKLGLSERRVKRS